MSLPKERTNMFTVGSPSLGTLSPKANYAPFKTLGPPDGGVNGPTALRMVGPADYGLRAGRVGVLKREHQRRLSALTRLARSIGAAPHGCGSCNRAVGRNLVRSRQFFAVTRCCGTIAKGTSAPLQIS